MGGRTASDVAAPERAQHVRRLRDQLDRYMCQRGLRTTEQRRLIIEEFFESAGHVTIDELLALVNRREPSIGYATVYRTLKMLAQGAIAQEHKFSDGMSRYELADDAAHHDHLICVDCGQIQEFCDPSIEDAQERIAQDRGFVLMDHKHELYGRCQRCAHKARSGV